MGFTRSGSIDFIDATGAFSGAIQAGNKVSGVFSPSLRTTAGMQCRLKPELLRSLIRFGAAAAWDVGVISIERRTYCAYRFRSATASISTRQRGESSCTSMVNPVGMVDERR